MPTQKFHVQGLRHEAEGDVVECVRSLDGVLFAAANHQDECLEVEFEDDLVTPEEICQALRRIGYSGDTAG